MKRIMLFLTLLCLCISASASASTVAYWRFEEGPLGANVARGGLPNGTYYPGAMDSSGNSYHLSAWSDGGFAGEGYRNAVPMGVVPLTHAANTLCLQSTGDVPGMWTNDVTLDSWAPGAWTVEAWARCTSINNWRVIVGRDGDDINGDNPAFRIMFTNYNAVRASFCDMSKGYHELNSSGNLVVNDRWYHIAATSDGSTFILYVDNVEVARKVLNTADTRMSNGTNGRAAGGDWHQGAWTVFRGMWNGGHSDRWYGYIDEVRVSDTALTPDQFLTSGAVLEGPQDWAVFPEDVTTGTFTVTAAAVPYGETMADVTWYKDSPDPNTVIIPDGIKYSVNTTATQSTLTIYDVTGTDETDYHAKATFTDATVANSTRKAHLYIRSGLVHRYSFDGNVNDAIGTAHGTIVDPNALSSFVDGQLLLNNPAVNASPAEANSIAYVELPAGIISSLDNFMTVEMWLTPHRNANWTTFFAFGDTWNPDPFVQGFTGGRVGMLAQLNRDVTGARGPSFTTIAPGGNQRTLTSPDSYQLALEQQIMYAVTWNGNNGQMRHYINGVLIDTDTINAKLSEMEDVKCWLGLPFWGDAVLNASLNEMRIYDTALPSYYINAHNLVGPDVTVVELKPAVAAPAAVAVYPDLRDDDADAAQMVAAVTDKPAGTTVTGAVWYKDLDPAIAGDEVALADNAKYDISFTDNDTTLMINGVTSADEAYYYATVTINTGAAGTGGSAKLTVCQGLVHRWSFSGDLTDSIGDADGTLFDPAGLASFVGGTQLLLANSDDAPNANPNGVAYVTLPAGIISALDNYATIEMWVTPHAKQGNWVNMFAFGSDRDGDPLNYTGGDGIIGSLRGDGIDSPLFSYDINGAQRWRVAGPAALDQEMLFAMAWDGNTGTGTLYVIDAAGTQVASAAITGNRILANIDDTANIIGGNWWNDFMLNGTINEMRIYDWAFDAAWIKEHYIVGPDATAVNPCLEYSPFDVTGGDGNGEARDCKVDILDFAKFAEDWLTCGRLDACN